MGDPLQDQERHLQGRPKSIRVEMNEIRRQTPQDPATPTTEGTTTGPKETGITTAATDPIIVMTTNTTNTPLINNNPHTPQEAVSPARAWAPPQTRLLYEVAPTIMARLQAVLILKGDLPTTDTTPIPDLGPAVGRAPSITRPTSTIPTILDLLTPTNLCRHHRYTSQRNQTERARITSKIPEEQKPRRCLRPLTPPLTVIPEGPA